ncbi:MAG TPA: hypothetical protein VKV25_00945, partial [Acidimicrobiales bacterium]|nr:hypothetical protein [Acidimicrobiales bacterium]
MTSRRGRGCPTVLAAVAALLATGFVAAPAGATPATARPPAPRSVSPETGPGTSPGPESTGPGSNPGPDGTVLQAVSCPSAKDCVAVGYYAADQLTAYGIVEAWNGTSWSVVPAPPPAGATFSTLYGVSCAGPDDCMAVGDWSPDDGVVTLPLAEHWDGQRWTVTPIPAPDGSSYALFNGVSCQASGCMAVGTGDDPAGTPVTLAEGWNGSTWTLLRTPNPAGIKSSELSAVSCAAGRCAAVGYFVNTKNAALTLTEAWQGGHWSLVPSPNPAGARENFLIGVSCSGPAACFAVGNWSTNPFTPRTTLTEAWNGSKWRLVPSPSPAGAGFSTLDAVACTSPSSCTAVGDDTDAAGNSVTLAESWDGAAWSIV